MKKQSNSPISFAERVYAQLRKVPKGKVTTYKFLAESLGTKAYRAVGHALSQNPYAPLVPCHRVVASDGSIGGFMGKKQGPTIEKKKNLLQEEGVNITENKIVDFSQRVFTF